MLLKLEIWNGVRIGGPEGPAAIDPLVSWREVEIWHPPYRWSFILAARWQRAAAARKSAGAELEFPTARVTVRMPPSEHRTAPDGPTFRSAAGKGAASRSSANW